MCGILFLYKWYRMLNILGACLWNFDSISCRCIKYWESSATSNTIECQGFCRSQHFYISKSSRCGVIRGKLDQLPEGRSKEPFRVSFQLLFFLPLNLPLFLILFKSNYIVTGIGNEQTTTPPFHPAPPFFLHLLQGRQV